MAEGQLAALLAKLEEDSDLRQKFQGDLDLDTAVAMSKEAGFDVSEEDWIKYQSTPVELSDEDLAQVAGGVILTIRPKSAKVITVRASGSMGKALTNGGY